MQGRLKYRIVAAPIQKSIVLHLADTAINHVTADLALFCVFYIGQVIFVCLSRSNELDAIGERLFDMERDYSICTD